MSMRIQRAVVLTALVFAGCGASLSAQAIATARVASGLLRPVYVGAPKGDLQRVFVIEQWEARIRIIKNGSLLPTPFLDLPVTTVINSGNERGLLGMAFDPDYTANGYFFVNYNDLSGNTVIARYQRAPGGSGDTADINSGRILQMTPGITTYSLSQPFSNNNGGWMDFGPDGNLYIATGDGGGGATANGQNVNTLLGKILRVDVDNQFPPYYFSPPTNPFYGVPNSRSEIWAYGLRNPWRSSFDRVTGELYLGDVGLNAREELDWQPAYNSANPAATAGRNYGWACEEGNSSFGACTPPNYVAPFYDYQQGVGPSQGFCIIGGCVYRGCSIPGLEGTYFFADYQTNRLWSLRLNGTAVSAFTDRTACLQTAANGGTISGPASFGEDGFGEICICSHTTGEIYKIVPAAANTAGATLGVSGSPAINSTITFSLSSHQDGNRGYVLALAFGTSPGIVLPDLRVIPLNPDFLFFATIDPQYPILAGHYGTLSPTGNGTVQLAIPNAPVLVGLQVYADFVVTLATAPSGIQKIACPRLVTIQ